MTIPSRLSGTVELAARIEVAEVEAARCLRRSCRADAPEELGFQPKIEHLLAVTNADPQVWAALTAHHDIQLRCAIYLHRWTEGFVLPWTTVAAIGQRRWTFGLSMYSAEGDEIVEAFVSGTPSSPTPTSS